MTLTLTRIIAGLVGLGALGVLGPWLATVLLDNVNDDPVRSLGVPVDTRLIARGAYLAIAGDCAACHTAPGGRAFAGGLALATPIGAVYASNITPDKETGIGNYSYGDFERALRRGIRPDGSTLYPAMPFPSYARVTDGDTKALYAYFQHGIVAVRQPDKSPDIAWPLSMRWPLTYWRWLFSPEVSETAQISNADPLRDRGTYLVEGLGHCGACHTPRGLGLEEKALTDRDGPHYLSGSLVDNYVASDLRGDLLTGLGTWTQDDIVQFLQAGRNKNAAAFGGMSDVIIHSTQGMHTEDIRAIAHYLKSLPASGSETAFFYKIAVASALASGNVSMRGALDYLNNCAACHLSSGKGYSQTFPALAGNPVVNTSDPSSLINIVLNGGTMPPTNAAPTHFTMPSLGARLSDQEVADVLTFIRSSWGNRASSVVPLQVARMRSVTRTARREPSP